MAEPAPRRRRWWRALLGIGALGLILVGAGNAWVLHATAADIVPDVGAAPDRPVAIVLGNRVFPDGSLSRELAMRVGVALELYRAGKVQRIFLSGAWREAEGYDEPGAMAAWFGRRGVPRAALILDRGGYRTAATMADAAAQGLREALVCTQRYHLPRALYLARHAGIAARGVVARVAPATLFDRLHTFVRESLARAETVGEVAVRGVSAN
ncbi:MAG TPA: ElyC/SanA/YdcF family protein [Polyangia bacterium]|nr:ElyC/SanA/YdcF family protein [Polyangia bacterium]